METTGKMAAFYVQKHARAGKAIYLHTGDDIYFMQLHWLIYQRSVTWHQLYIFLKIQHFLLCFVIWSHHGSNSQMLSGGSGLTAIIPALLGQRKMFISEHKKEQNERTEFQAAEFGSRMTQTQFATRLMFCFCYINLALLAAKRPGKTICDCRTFWTQPAKTQTTEPSE